MEKRGGAYAQNRSSSRSDQAVSWRRSNEFVSTSSRSPDSNSWRRPSPSSEDSSTSRRQKRVQPSSNVSLTSATQRGRLATLHLSEGYGFLTPIGQGDINNNNIYFRFGDNSKAETGMLQLQVGDIFEYISNEITANPRVLYACLLHCKQRSLEALLAYLNTLLENCKINPERVLREITRCTVGFLQVLNYRNPPFSHVRLVIKIVSIISEHNEAPLYATRLKQLYRLFSGTAFLQSSLREHAAELFQTPKREKRVKNLLVRLAEHSSESVSDILPLLKDIVEAQGGEELDCHCQFFLHLLTAQAGNATISACNVEWNKMQLVPTNFEITETPTDDTSVADYFKGLPYVKKKGSYGSIDAYMDTYFRLLKVDCFWGLKKGISDLRNNRLEARDMRIWPNGVVIGFHFGVYPSGITVAVATEKLSVSRLPMEGSLLCLCDDGGNFDSPIWGLLAHCEEWKKGMVVIFVEIVDATHGSAEAQVQGIGRLLLASRVVITESPVFYKAYLPVLKALQEKDLEHFPLAEELVFAKWPSTPPQYLTHPSATLNWRCLFTDNEPVFPQETPTLGSLPNFLATFIGIANTRISVEGQSPKLRRLCDGPNAMRGHVHELDNFIKSGHKTSLDESQIEAIKLALSNRLVLIQGPPGTGKTYVGVKIMQLLLSASTLPSGPILVITYKNHGLDNFLVGCLKFCKNLVRVGRRSKETSLQEYNLSSKVSRDDEFTSEWTSCSHRLKQVRSKMEITFRQLRDCNAFNSETVINHMPDSQVRLLLSKSEAGRNLLKLFPDEISLGESIRGGIRESMETRNLVTSLYKSISTQIRQWIPHKKTFELVENCFSLCKPPRALNETRQHNTRDTLFDVEELSDLEEDEEELSDDEFMDEKKSAKKQSWLQENFFHFRIEDKDNLFSKRVNLHIDINKYRWLLKENPWHLNEHCRVLLVHVIMQAQYEMALTMLACLKKEYDETLDMIKEIKDRRQLRVLERSQIVGMTTAGAAMYLNVLKMIRPSIVFVEEASEVLEPQVSAVLGPSVQHLILIGDHYQLSPHVACYELERRHDFAVSMFERLVEHNKMPFQALSVQSRMREEFLPMILPIYPHVRSNTNLVRGERNEAPACIMSPMHFWCHSYPETRHQHSFANQGEAEMVLALLIWMMSEGEDPQQITVLAAYNGQVSLLREKLQKCPSAKDVQVHSIDRFQGSENKIVIVSLVRSNEDGDIGYLAKRNRLCVSVSRARGALYFCGNHITFVEKSLHWRALVDFFKDRQCLSEEIYLSCPRHPMDPPFAICNKDVYSFNPLLCKRPCTAILKCNHGCQSSCHHGIHPVCSTEIQFEFQSCGHEATKQCSEDEESQVCLKELSYTFDECGHTDVFKCWRVTKKQGLNCMHACRKDLECGHPCALKCFQKCNAEPCGICVQIQREKAAKEKQREAMELKLKKEELEKEIARLKSQDDVGEVSIIELDSEGETAPEYFQVRDRTEKFIQPQHGILPIVIKIENVHSLKLQIKFLETQKELISPTSPTQLLFHGTTDEAIQRILEEGFRLPPRDKGNMYGQGIYFATDSSKSAQQIYTKGSNKLLVCEVLLGRTLTVQAADTGMDKEKINKRGFDSLFSKRDGKQTGGTLTDEFVVYDPHQAIPRYIVHYENLAFNPSIMAPGIPASDQNLTRAQYESSPTFSGDSPAEYHFRLAESQFFRMSSRNDYKVIKVEHILNKALQKQYDNAKKEFAKLNKSAEEKLVFHGTDKDAIENIIEGGFKIGGQGVPVRHGKAYGSGVYTALDPSISIDYSKGGMILLSCALVGQKDVDYKEGGSSGVLVLNKTDHLLPKYIVHFEKK